MWFKRKPKPELLTKEDLNALRRDLAAALRAMSASRDSRFNALAEALGYEWKKTGMVDSRAKLGCWAAKFEYVKKEGQE